MKHFRCMTFFFEIHLSASNPVLPLRQPPYVMLFPKFPSQYAEKELFSLVENIVFICRGGTVHERATDAMRDARHMHC